MPMRLPDDFRNCVSFLGTRLPDGGVSYRGTVFVIGYPVPDRRNYYHTYLATAAHNIRYARSSGTGLVIRYNTTDGGSVEVDTTTDWYYHPDESVDLAVVPFDPPEKYQTGLIPVETFATDDLLQEHNFGIGDEVMAVGLFYFRHGKMRNLPVVRSGMIASMPEEPFPDDNTGLTYEAYLVEMRSFGGLSGTPVFTVIHRGSLMNRPGRVFSPLVHNLALIGVIRGHWKIRGTSQNLEVEQANLGLTIVTPAQQLTQLLMRPELVALRNEEEASLPPASDD